MFRVLFGLSLLVIPSIAAAAEPAVDFHWKRITLDETFRSEGVAAADESVEGSRYLWFTQANGYSF